ncbi:MAG: hypothetical protein JNM39_05165 [Bdellovibrionaceae bacterium]|nr:hypothetical protein [Pseudobdellovibrionaceae bacterium]
MINVLLSLILGAMLLTSTESFAGSRCSYGKLEMLFQKAETPVMTSFGNGWFAGRCYTRNEPKIEKAGVLVLMPGPEYVGLKQIIPASSLRSEVDYFDEIDQEEYEVYSQELYAESNPTGSLLNDSFTSDLYYGILIGTLHTRQIGNELLVTMTNYEETPALTHNGHFYCRMTKKVREL